MNWMEIVVRVSHTATEAVADIFQELGSGGVVIEDPELLNFYINSVWDCTDLRVVEKADVVTLKAYFPINEQLTKTLKDIKTALTELEQRVPNSVQGDFLYREVNEEDWSTSWKQYFHPIRVGQKIIIKPTWEDYSEKEGDLIIELDPGMAFGTGTHHTTNLCIEKLEELDLLDKLVFDVGAGSGILSLVSARLGAKKVVAIELDKVAVKVARENVALNKLENIITVKEGDLLTSVQEEADVIVANIIAKIIVNLLPDIPRKLKLGGVFLASGIITEHIGTVCQKAQEVGLNVLEVKEKSDWAMILLRKGK